MADGNTIMSVKKLAGRSNYYDWAWDVQQYLEFEDLWDVLEAPTDGSLCTNARKVTKARTIINMSYYLYVIPKVKSLIRGERDALKAWNVLKRAYENKGAVNRIGLLRELILTKLEDCASTDVYVDKKITAAEKISGTGLNVPDE